MITLKKGGQILMASALVYAGASHADKQYCFTNSFLTAALEGGAYASQQDYHSTMTAPGALSSDQKISNQGGVLGVRLSLDHRFLKSENWALGLTAAYRRFLNATTKTTSGANPTFAFTYQSTFDNRYELSLRSGWRLPRDVNLYLKAGGVVVRRNVKVSDSTFVSNETDHTLGWVVGAAAYYPVTSGFLMGASIDYERYRRKGHPLWDNATPPGTVESYRVTPSFITFMLSANFQWDFVVNTLKPVE